MKYALILEELFSYLNADRDDDSFSYEKLAVVSDDLETIKTVRALNWSDGEFGLLNEKDEACIGGRIIDLDEMKVIFEYDGNRWVAVDRPEYNVKLAA